MVGVGLDSDGHKRVTAGENFVLAGGTQETHEDMTEKAIKINEKLRQRGKHLGQGAPTVGPRQPGLLRTRQDPCRPRRRRL